ncbi:hypothetical protein AGMMS49944_26530 [Spirochaetia bacterium]|nr:hypothetical protein AGMMS49944_26530 [Spirochaetia bacterium]
MSECTKLKEINASAFYYTRALKEAVNLTLSAGSLTTIGNSAFYYSGITSIDFTGCTKLDTINSSTFSNCLSLASVTLTGTSLKTIDDNAFYGCTALTTINLEPVKSTLKNIKTSAFYNCNRLATVNLSSCTALETIGDSAFYRTTDFIEDLEFKSTSALKTIGSSTFAYSGVKKLTVDGAPIELIKNNAFDHSKLVTADIKSNTKLLDIGASAFAYCRSLTG